MTMIQFDSRRGLQMQLQFNIKVEQKKEDKVWSEIKETTFQVGHFTTISGHSIANYINIFHKTEVPTVILRCLMSLNLNWIKSYDINYKLFWQLCFSILEEKKAPKMAIFWPFVIFFTKLRFRRSFWGTCWSKAKT